MPDFEFEFSQQDTDVVLNQQSSELTNSDYVRLTIYVNTSNTVVSLEDNTKGVDGQAIFFSTLNSQYYPIDISPFKINNQFTALDYSGEFNDFKIYKNGENIFIKPNEIFNKFGLPQGNYRIQVDFLNQVKPILTQPTADTTEDNETAPDNDVVTQQQFYQFVIKEISAS